MPTSRNPPGATSATLEVVCPNLTCELLIPIQVEIAGQSQTWLARGEVAGDDLTAKHQAALTQIISAFSDEAVDQRFHVVLVNGDSQSRGFIPRDAVGDHDDPLLTPLRGGGALLVGCLRTQGGDRL